MTTLTNEQRIEALEKAVEAQSILIADLKEKLEGKIRQDSNDINLAMFSS